MKYLFCAVHVILLGSIYAVWSQEHNSRRITFSENEINSWKAESFSTE